VIPGIRQECGSTGNVVGGTTVLENPEAHLVLIEIERIAAIHIAVAAQDAIEEGAVNVGFDPGFNGNGTCNVEA
jgi:hypothetical protein